MSTWKCAAKEPTIEAKTFTLTSSSCFIIFLILANGNSWTLKSFWETTDEKVTKNWLTSAVVSKDRVYWNISNEVLREEESWPHHYHCV